MQDVINELKKSQSQEECLRKAYDVLILKYHGNRIKTITRIMDFFEHDVDVLWGKAGFMHCNNINRILKSILIESGFFKKEDIKTRWTLIWYVSPHQYAQVRIGGKWIDIDIWAHVYGIKFGDYAHGFH